MAPLRSLPMRGGWAWRGSRRTIYWGSLRAAFGSEMPQRQSGVIRGDQMMDTYRSDQAIPEQEKHQPDSMLQMSTGRMGGAAVMLAAIVAAVVLGVVFYGLNTGSQTEQTSSFPPAQSAHPQAGGNSGAANRQ